MTFLQILKIVGAIGTVLTGLVSLIRPHAIKGFTGLVAESGRGVTEIRSILGGVFIGLGVAPFILGQPSTYQVIGIMYLVVGAVRLVSMFIDRSVVQSNIISLVVEVIFGIILVL